MSSRASTRDFTQRTLNGAAWIGGASVVRLGLRVFSVGILARLLSPQEYGIVAGALVALDFATMVYTLGLAPTLVQRKEVRHDHVATALFSSLAMAVVTAGGMWVASPWLASLMRIPELVDILRVFALLAPVGAFNVLAEALLARNMQTKSVALRPLFSVVIAAFAVAIPMAYAGFGYWSLVAMQVVETIFGAIAFGIAARKYLVRPAFSRLAFRELWPMSLGFSINQPFVFLATNADNFLIARLMGAQALGLYSRASFVTNTAANLFNNIARLTAFPAMAQVQDDSERLRNALLTSLSLIALVALPTSAYCIIFAKEIIGILLGPKWHAVVVPFSILLPSLYFRLGTRTFYALFQARGKSYLTVGTHAFHASLLLFGTAIAVPNGLAAICMAVLAVSIAVFFVLLILVWREIGLPIKRLVALHVRPVLFTSSLSALAMIIKASGLPESVSAATSFIVALALTLVLLKRWPGLILPPIGMDVLQRISESLSTRFNGNRKDR